jgi:hypothetical protein
MHFHTDPHWRASKKPERIAAGGLSKMDGLRQGAHPHRREHDFRRSSVNDNPALKGIWALLRTTNACPGTAVAQSALE